MKTFAVTFSRVSISNVSQGFAEQDTCPIPPSIETGAVPEWNAVPRERGSTLHPDQTPVDARVLYALIKNCVQNQRHIGISSWICLLKAKTADHKTKIVQSLEGHAAPARLQLALQHAVDLVMARAPTENARCNPTINNRHTHKLSIQLPAQQQLSDADAVLCSSLLIHAATTVLLNSPAALSASELREMFARLCMCLECDLGALNAEAPGASEQCLSFNSELLAASVHQTLLYLRENMKHGAASVCPCMSFLLTLAIRAEMPADIANQIDEQGNIHR